ncbi:patatin-domain-containing protein, partial [Aureobasidium melanogenum]
MDFFHDSLVLPGSSAVLGSNVTTNNASSKSTKPNAGTSRLSPSLLKALRDPYQLIGAKPVEPGNQRPRPEGPQLDDSEWRRQVLNLKISQACSFLDAWKEKEECDEYDTALLKARLEELEDARISCDAKRMLFLARTSLTRDLGGMGDLRLYKHCRVGTKSLIERYISAALEMLETIVDMCSPANKNNTDVDVREVYEQLLSARQAFGRSALLLSGGGTLGMNHIGVLKTLFEAHLLPRIISGASAGSIVAAVLCTKTDDEIPQVLREFCYGDLDVFEREGEPENVLKKVFRFCTKGALFDISNLIRVMKDLLGDMTFQEAYNRTRRILNIGVSTASLYELPRLLNYITAPNVMIWSAVATSCSVPFVFSPAQLLAKDPRTGLEIPWDQSPQRWIDGSVDNDLPMSRLAEMFNVNHFIVSQVNPHVVPFLERDDEIAAFGSQSSRFSLSAGPSWLRNVANLAKGEALHRMHVLSELGVLPTTMSKLRSVLSQRYSGDITILPEVSYTQFPRVLRNPTTDFMSRAMLSGEKATWPKLSEVRNHCAIELALDTAVQKYCCERDSDAAHTTGQPWQSFRKRTTTSPCCSSHILYAQTKHSRRLGRRRLVRLFTRRLSHTSTSQIVASYFHLPLPTRDTQSNTSLGMVRRKRSLTTGFRGFGVHGNLQSVQWGQITWESWGCSRSTSTYAIHTQQILSACHWLSAPSQNRPYLIMICHPYFLNHLCIYIANDSAISRTEFFLIVGEIWYRPLVVQASVSVCWDERTMSTRKETQR